MLDKSYLKETFIPVYNGNIPVYIQLANYFRTQIKFGILKEKSQLLTEKEICQTLDLSRTTVRQSLKLLVEEGILVRSRGKGTFVSNRKIRRSLNQLYSFTNDMNTLGLTASSVVLKQEVIEASNSEIKQKMEIDKNKKVFHLIRVREADEKPIIYEDTHIPYHLCAGIEKYDFNNTSLYDLLQNKYGIVPYKGLETLIAVIIPVSIKDHLECESNTVGYMINRIARLESNAIYEYTKSYTRADICSYQFELNSTHKLPESKSNLVMNFPLDKDN